MASRARAPSVVRTVDGRSEFIEDAIKIPDGRVTLDERSRNLQRSPFTLVEASRDRALDFCRIVEVSGMPCAGRSPRSISFDQNVFRRRAVHLHEAARQARAEGDESWRIKAV